MVLLAVVSVLQMVTPLAGAWIEILLKDLGTVVDAVTPLAGAWIEIRTADQCCS